MDPTKTEDVTAPATDAADVETDEAVKPPAADVAPDGADDQKKDDSTPAPGKDAAAEGDPKDGKEGTTGDEPADATAYELKVPDGSLLSAEKIEEVKNFAKKYSLSMEAAQEALEAQHRLIAETGPALEKQFVENLRKNHQEVTVKKWEEELKADRELGGQRLPETQAAVDRFVKRFGSPAFSQMLKEAGYGLNPEVVRVFARAGRAIADDTLVRGGDNVRGPRKTPEEVFYGGKKQGSADVQ